MADDFKHIEEQIDDVRDFHAGAIPYSRLDIAANTMQAMLDVVRAAEVDFYERTGMDATKRLAAWQALADALDKLKGNKDD